ncbi:MAG: DUF2914 domain-containing protein [Alphaproteobacteria bacterium]
MKAILGAMVALAVALPAYAAGDGSVARAQFTQSVIDREPTNQIRTLANDQRQIYFYTDLRDLGGQRVIHRWEYNGRVFAEIPFNVGGDRWRVWSSKNFVPEWVGTWTVSVIDQSGNVVTSRTLNYTQTASARTMPGTTTPAYAQEPKVPATSR